MINPLKALERMIFRQNSWVSFMQPNSRIDFSEGVGDGTTSSTVMAPLLWICRTFPEAPIALWKKDSKGQEERAAEHDLLRLMQRPNGHYSGAILWMATLCDWNVDGNAYWLKLRNKANAVQEIWWAPSWMLEPVGNPSDDSVFIDHYDYRPGGGAVQPLDPADVVHFRFGLDPNNDRKGMSPLKSALREVFTDNEAANFTASLLRNMGVPGLIVSPKGEATVSPDDAEAIKARMNQEAGGDKRGSTHVFKSPTDVIQFGFNPQQMDLKALRRIPEERVSACLGVPAIVAGLGAGLDRSTFANMSEAREMAYESNIIPSQRILGEDLRFQLLPDFERDPWSWRVGFDLSQVRVLQEDRDKLVTRMDVGVKGGWIRRSEARRAVDLPVEPGDEVFLIPLNLIETPVGQAPPTPFLPAKGIKARGTQAQRALLAALDADAKRLESVFAEELEHDFDELGKAAEAEALTIHSLAARLNGGQMKADDQVVARILAAIDAASWGTSKLKPRFEAQYLRTSNLTVETINTTMGLGTMIPDPVQAKIIELGGTRAGLVDIEAQARASIFQALTAGREEGLGPPALARRIRENVSAGRFVNAGPKYRAQLISRTETKFAQRTSSLAAYREAEGVTGVVIFDARLGPTDEECEERDGEVMSFDEAEALEEHPNGTLDFAPATSETVGANA